MNTYTEISKEKNLQAAANSLAQNKNTAQLVDNRTSSKSMITNNTLVKQLKSFQAIADFNAEKTIQRHEEETEQEPVHENEEMEHEAESEPVQMMQKSSLNTTSSNSNVVQLVNGITFTKAQREKLLARNKASNGGFHTCTHCGFRHAKVNYATYRGRRIGDGGFQIDHILHASRGGRNLIRNGRVLCGTCNTSRGNRLHVGKTGRAKYRGLHGKRAAKNYARKPR